VKITSVQYSTQIITVHIFFYVTCWILDIINIIHIKQAPVNAMKADGELKEQLHSFLTSALDVGKWPMSHHLLLSMGKMTTLQTAQLAEWAIQPVWTL
jgi:hypothetical protein